METKEQVEEQEQTEERKECGNCKSYFKVHFNTVGMEDQMPHDETQSACIAISPPVLLNRFVGQMGLTPEQSPFVKSCTHFETRDEIAIAKKMLEWFFSREDQIKKQSYEPLFLELANLLVEGKEFKTIENVLNWMEGKEEEPEPEETKDKE